MCGIVLRVRLSGPAGEGAVGAQSQHRHGRERRRLFGEVAADDMEKRIADELEGADGRGTRIAGPVAATRLRQHEAVEKGFKRETRLGDRRIDRDRLRRGRRPALRLAGFLGGGRGQPERGNPGACQGGPPLRLRARMPTAFAHPKAPIQ